MRMEINGLGNRTHLLEVMPINDEGSKGSDLRYFVIFLRTIVTKEVRFFPDFFRFILLQIS